jgi:phosphoribosylamine---glycine ligase
MNVLLLGSGGREHALAWKMAQSQHCDALYIAPGNPGTASLGTNIAIDVLDFTAIKQFCISEQIDVLVVGPEEPLVKGVYDFMQDATKLAPWNGIVVGPSKQAAQLEGSKAFSKQFMQKYGIPTAAYAEFTAATIAEGRTYIEQHRLPIVLKADGLAAGKGVVIAQTHAEALQTFDDMLLNHQFGLAGSKVVIEAFLTGIELSVFVLTNGRDYQVIGHAKDYKRIGEGDTGPNTGGMGCVTPLPFFTNQFMQLVDATIIQPTINGLAAENLVYNGFIFFGLMNCDGIPYVIEYNCRMGDPETEVVMPALETDLLALFAAMDNGTLSDANISYHPGSFATVMAVSGGYPGTYEKHLPISGLEAFLASNQLLFQAGTTSSNNQIITNGGRVLAVTSNASTIPEAAAASLQALQKIHFQDIYYRKDIGYEFV